MKKLLSLALCATLCLALLAACGKAPASSTSAPSSSAPSVETELPYTLRVAALKGPTAMGLVALMDGAAGNEGAAQPRGFYDFSLAGSPDEISPKLISPKPELDIACVPANLAAVLYQKTQGQIVTLAVNTLGVLYLMENGNTIQSMSDLKGQTIVASVKGASTEYALRYLLTENGLDPDKDVDIQWKSEHAECVSALAAGSATIALLPQPFVTVAAGKLPELRVALDLNEEWAKLDNGSQLVTGVVVGRKELLEQYPKATALFLQDYADSVAWVNENTAEAAALIGEYGIVDAAVAEKALPACNIVCLSGADMKAALSGYLAVLHQQTPEAVGGALPGDDFYYGA